LLLLYFRRAIDLLSFFIIIEMTCGYICPLCEGTGMDEQGADCSWCNSIQINKPIFSQCLIKPDDISDEEWLKQVHEGNCCSDSER
jgi:hypothetical protein